ncbi:radical SAM protein [Candidatus Pacearchaeota archaeon]|nr:radical SAM protein [Candidatus Pacearchaeota archaeon]
MKMRLIYPKWRKLERQTHFNLPPHGPVVFAATLPDYVDLGFTDENVDTLDMEESPDIIAISIMLVAQIPRAIEIATHFRARGITVMAGGISTALVSEEVAKHVDCVFIGEAEGRIEQTLQDFQDGKLAKMYRSNENPPIELVGNARREILNREKYAHSGVQMLDLVHASRGCRFSCDPCCTPFLGGVSFRPRPIEKVIEEIESIDNNRLFLVDNSLAQNYEWEEELFKALIPLKKKWVSHPIEDDDKLLDLAYKSGAWYVYQAIFDTSDHIRDRVKRYKDHGIGVEGTILLGTDDQDVDYIKRLVDFLLEIDLDLAEFTIMTPFPHTPVRDRWEKAGRIISNDFSDYTCDRVVFQPQRMTVDELQEMYYYAWDTFYKDRSQELKMADLFMKVVQREIADGTYKAPERKPRSVIVTP